MHYETGVASFFWPSRIMYSVGYALSKKNKKKTLYLKDDIVEQYTQAPNVCCLGQPEAVISGVYNI